MRGKQARKSRLGLPQGGPARAKSISPAEKKAIAQKGAKARLK
jgi:hypothetical protein